MDPNPETQSKQAEEQKTPEQLEAEKKKQEERLKRKQEYEEIMAARLKKLTETPYSKIKLPLNPKAQNICLVMGGCFYPIHNNHIRMFTIAKEYLLKNRTEYNIIGGYILPNHANSLKKKLGAPL